MHALLNRAASGELAHLTKDAANAKTTLGRITADLERDYAQFQVDKLATLKEVASAFVSIQLVNAQQVQSSTNWWVALNLQTVDMRVLASSSR